MALRPPLRFTQYRGHERLVAPAVEPITAAQLKEALGLASSDAYTLLDLYITSAREQFEAVTGRALITQEWRMTIDRWPSGHGEPWWDGVQEGAIADVHAPGRLSWVVLPRYRLQSVDTITVFDDDGTSSTVTIADVFITDTQQEPGRLVLKNGATWPVALQRANAIRIDYTAGYGATAADVPAAIRVALLQFAAFLYGHRGDDCAGESAMKQSGAWDTFQRFMVRRL